MRAFAFVFLLSGMALGDTLAERAERLFREGRDAVKAGDWISACPKFTESQRLEPAPGTLMNLADCEAHVGEIVAARNDFALAASGFQKNDPRRALVLARAAELEKRIAHVTIRIGTPVVGMVVRRGNAIVWPADFGRAADVDPGEIDVVVSAPGHVDRRETIRVADGASVDRTFEVGPAIAPKTVIVREKARGNPWRTAGLVVGGVGVAGVAIGVVTGILTIDRANAVKQHCDAAMMCDAQGWAAAQDGKVLSPLSTTALVAGAAMAAVGVVLFAWNGGRARVDVALAPSGGSLRGEF